MLLFAQPVVPTYEDRMTEALELRRQGHAALAEKLYDTVLRDNPKDVDALVGRGFCRLGDPSRAHEALNDFRTAAALAPRYADAYIGMARACELKGKRSMATAILKDGINALATDSAASRYFAHLCWENSFFPTARAVDKAFKPDPGRALIARPFSAMADESYDRLFNDDTWWVSSLVVQYKPRPDLQAWAAAMPVGRYQRTDFLAGAGAAFRYDKFLSLTYEGLFSDKAGFCPVQKHRPLVLYALLRSTVLGLGADLSAYADGWARLGRAEITQYAGDSYAHYAFIAGKDNVDQNIVAHVGDMQYVRDGKFAIGFGGSYGNETADLVGSEYTQSLVQSIFASFSFVINPLVALRTTLGREWRDHDSFRTMVNVGTTVNF